MKSKKFICNKCKYGSPFYKKKLPKCYRWCVKQSALRKNVKQCNDFMEKDENN